MIKQTIKVGDWVYVPRYSTKVLKVQSDNDGMFVKITDLVQPLLKSNGFNSVHDLIPLAFLATPENKAKIEAFYGIELESVSIDKELEAFKKALAAFHELTLNNPSDQDYQAVLYNGLVRMFKEKLLIGG